MELEEIEMHAKRCGCSQCRQTLKLLSIIHHLKEAIEKHKLECYFSNPNDPFDGLFEPADSELYKTLEEEE